MLKNLSIIILAGGKGKRLLPITKELPKPLIKINNKEILSYVIDSLSKLNKGKIFVLTGYKASLINQFILKKYKHKNISSKFTGVNSDISLRIRKIFKHLDKNILICYGDTFANVNFKKLINLYLNKNKSTIISSYQQKSNFGLVKYNKKKLILSFDEKPVLDSDINIGYILISKKNLEYIKYYKNFGNFLKYLVKQKKVYAHKHFGRHVTVNTLYELNEARESLRKIY